MLLNKYTFHFISLVTKVTKSDACVQVRLLWDTARRNNFELHNLESKAQDAEKRLKVTKSRVEKVSDFFSLILLLQFESVS